MLCNWEVVEFMKNDQGMILIESLLLLVICSILSCILLGYALVYRTLHTTQKEVFQNEELQRIYQSE